MERFNKNIILRYFEGTASKEEKDKLFDWLNTNQHNKQLFSEYKNVWIASEDADKNEWKDPDTAFQIFRTKIQKKNNGDIKLITSSGGYQWLKYAANVIIIIAIGFLTYQLGLKRNQYPQANLYNEISVPLGGISSIMLPDSTLVWLHSGSKLKYKTNFGQENREIHLEGEAYFDVAKNQDLPFMVQTSHMDIQVTGTRFNVKSYPDDDKIETTLEEGSINITRIKGSKIGQPIKLKPKEKLTLMKGTGSVSMEKKKSTLSGKEGTEKKVREQINSIERKVLITENVNPDESTSWKDGIYVLNNKPLGELAKTLERRYNVSISFEDPELRDYSYTGVLKDLTLDQVLNALKLTAQIEYTINERKVKLQKQNN